METPTAGFSSTWNICQTWLNLLIQRPRKSWRLLSSLLWEDTWVLGCHSRKGGLPPPHKGSGLQRNWVSQAGHGGAICRAWAWAWGLLHPVPSRALAWVTIFRYKALHWKTQEAGEFSTPCKSLSSQLLLTHLFPPSQARPEQITTDLDRV